MTQVINLSDLSEDEARLVSDFVWFLRERRKTKQPADEENEWHALAESNFAVDWDNNKDEIYNKWKELYNVSEG